MKMEQSVPKRRHIIFRRRGITQKETYNFFMYQFGGDACFEYLNFGMRILVRKQIIHLIT